jgi:hypothetical protein
VQRAQQRKVSAMQVNKMTIVCGPKLGAEATSKDLLLAAATLIASPWLSVSGIEQAMMFVFIATAK